MTFFEPVDFRDHPTVHQTKIAGVWRYIDLGDAIDGFVPDS